jgi:cytosine/adenosine deaminase-related metal-dependent hydrolase
VYSQIVYAAKAADVEDVLINGRQIVSGRHVLTLNQEEIYRKGEEYRQQITNGLPHRAVP